MAEHKGTVTSIRLSVRELQGCVALAEELGCPMSGERSSVLRALLTALLHTYGKDKHLDQTSQAALDWLKTRNIAFTGARNQRALQLELQADPAFGLEDETEYEVEEPDLDDFHEVFERARRKREGETNASE